MTTWKRALAEGAVAGSLASLLSTAYLLRAGQRRGQPAAPLNAVSHWIFGDRALERDAPSLLYTLTGFVIHHAASIFWGVLHAKAWGAREEHKQALHATAGAMAASAIACAVDYQLTPGRLTPGFEHRLARSEMARVYGLFAVGLLLGTLLMKGR
jgi:hypothetical protein